MKLINSKNGIKLSNLPKLKQDYDNINIPIGEDLIKKYFNKKEIKAVFITINELQRMGFKIIEDNIKQKRKMYPGQVYYYKLKREDYEEIRHETICKSLPDKVRIRFDLRRGHYGRGAIKLEGKGTGYPPPRGKFCGNWRSVKSIGGIK